MFFSFMSESRKVTIIVEYLPEITKFPFSNKYKGEIASTFFRSFRYAFEASGIQRERRTAGREVPESVPGNSGTQQTPSCFKLSECMAALFLRNVEAILGEKEKATKKKIKYSHIYGTEAMLRLLNSDEFVDGGETDVSLYFEKSLSGYKLIQDTTAYQKALLHQHKKASKHRETVDKAGEKKK